MKIGVTAGPVDEICIDNELALLDFGLSYEVWRTVMAHTASTTRPARDLTVQLRVGGRYSSVEVDVHSPDLGDRSRSESWVDPMVGAQINIPLLQELSFVVTGEVGGFGAASDIAWSAGGVFSWDFHLGSFPSSLQFGYLAIGDDYSTGSGADEFVWDTVLQGPLLNFLIRF
jgi:hypothetical protein